MPAKQKSNSGALVVYALAAFLALKISGVIKLSWWQLLWPLLAAAVLFVLAAIAYAALRSNNKSRRRRARR